MTEAVRAMFGSKKFLAAAVGVIVGVAGQYGLDIPAQELTVVLSPVLAYIVGQGVADAGKEKARVGQQASNP